MKIEQTYSQKKRMKYIPTSDEFVETKYESLLYVRKFKYPYGWITEFGTPPDRHFDVVLMSNKTCSLGEVVQIKVIGVFIRKDGDHKFIAVDTSRDIIDFSDLTHDEITALKMLYPCVSDGEGFFGSGVALSMLK